MATKLTNETFKSEVLELKKSCLIDFYADWCSPCKMMTPIIEELSKEFDGKFGVYRLDVDVAGEVAAKYNIASIPTLLFFKNGEIVESIVGVTSKEGLEEKINLYL